MEWLNYHHLLYFWIVAREGSIAAASRQLLLTPSTISMQLQALEKSLGRKLFLRTGRRLVLTDAGRKAYEYAHQIFSLGQAMQDQLQRQRDVQDLKLTVGITDVLSKLIAYRLLEPVFQIGAPVQLTCREGTAKELLADLALNRLELVLSDSPFDPAIRIRAFNHLLGECGLGIFGADSLARKFRRGFPGSLRDAPFLLPTSNTALRQSLDRWFSEESLRPVVQGEFEDSALIQVFGQAGRGLFAAPWIVEHEVRRQYRVRLVGRVESARCRFFAISTERTLKHPGIKAICDAARGRPFG